MFDIINVSKCQLSISLQHFFILHCLFRLNLLFLSRHSSVLVLCLGFRHENHLVKVQKTSWCGLKISVLGATETSGDGPTSCVVSWKCLCAYFL